MGSLNGRGVKRIHDVETEDMRHPNPLDVSVSTERCYSYRVIGKWFADREVLKA